MSERWAYHGFPNGNAHTVFLDQNISIIDLAEALVEEANVRVVRTLNIATVPDQVVLEEAERYDALLITRDRGFSRSERALVLRDKNFSRGHYARIIAAVKYIFGYANGLPEGYFGNNGSSAIRTRYGEHLDNLRSQFLDDQNLERMHPYAQF